MRDGQDQQAYGGRRRWPRHRAAALEEGRHWRGEQHASRHSGGRQGRASGARGVHLWRGMETVASQCLCRCGVHPTSVRPLSRVCTGERAEAQLCSVLACTSNLCAGSLPRSVDCPAASVLFCGAAQTLLPQLQVLRSLRRCSGTAVTPRRPPRRTPARCRCTPRRRRCRRSARRPPSCWRGWRSSPRR